LFFIGSQDAALHRDRVARRHAGRQAPGHRGRGFDGVEIFENDLLYFDGSPAEVKTICADLGLRVLLFQPFRDFEAAPRARMAKNFERAELKFDVMEQLGADLMLVCSNIAPDTLRDDECAAGDVRALGERAARRGLRIGYEALAWGRHVNTFGPRLEDRAGGGSSGRRAGRG
jgi:4-hydroxyphenylpyruvate dioxygenase